MKNVKVAESRSAVHTYTHTGNFIKQKNRNNIGKLYLVANQHKIQDMVFVLLNNIYF